MDPVWLCCTISLSKDITLSFLTANDSINDAIVFKYGKCSKISNTLKLKTPKIIAENNF